MHPNTCRTPQTALTARPPAEATIIIVDGDGCDDSIARIGLVEVGLLRDGGKN